MILVDTSALLDFLTGRRSEAAAYLHRALHEDAALVLTPIVVQEVLQGARDERDWKRLADYLLGQEMLLPIDPHLSHVAAARIYFECRRKGLTLRSTVDCLLAQIALEHGAALLHNDRDFEAIQKVRPLALLPRAQTQPSGGAPGRADTSGDAGDLRCAIHVASADPLGCAPDGSFSATGSLDGWVDLH